MRPLFVATLLIILLPSASRAAPDPGGALPLRQDVEAPKHDEHARAAGRPGELVTVPARKRPERGRLGALRVAVAVEGGLPVRPRRVARAIARILDNARGWRRAGYSFRRVGSAAFDIEVVLASPATTDRLCAPLLTLGRYSCAQGRRVVLNAARWRYGAPAYRSLARYRAYMVNHEVGHVLGRGHAFCPAAGARAPVMAQQTKGTAPCRPNPWPLAGE